MYVCMYVCINTYIYTYIYLYIYLYIYTYEWICDGSYGEKLFCAYVRSYIQYSSRHEMEYTTKWSTNPLKTTNQLRIQYTVFAIVS
jgi:hypothetical protein